MDTLAALTEERHQQLVKDVADILSHSIEFNPEVTEEEVGETYVECLQLIQSFSSETLHRIIGPSMSAEKLYDLVDWGYLSWSETKLNDYLHLTDLLETDSISQNQITPYIDALACYPQITPPLEDGHYPEERASQVRAVFRVTRHMLNSHNRIEDLIIYKNIRDDDPNWKQIPFIKNPGLRKLLLSSDCDREALVSLITTRSIFDPEALKEMLAATSPALLSGCL